MQTASPPVNVVFLDRQTIPPQTTLKEIPFPHHLYTFEQTRPSEVADRIRDADIVITNKVAITQPDIAQATRLKMVAIAATGTDNVDLKACASRGIVVSNIRNYGRFQG